MRIHTLWKMWDDEGIELLFALDDSTLAENYEAWKNGVKDACERYGITEADTRTVVIYVPFSEISSTFYPLEIPGEVVASSTKDGRDA